MTANEGAPSGIEAPSAGPTGAGDDRGPVAVGADVAAAVGTWLYERSTAAFLLVVGVAGVLRTGIGIHTHAELVAFAQHFPRPGGTTYSNAVAGPALAWVTGLRSRTGFFVLHGAATVVWAALVLVLLRRRSASEAAWRVAVVWVVASSAFVVAMQGIGLFDIWVLLGATCVALGSGLVLPVAGGILLGATNPILGVAAIVGHALVRSGLGDALPEASRTRRSTGLAVAALVLTAVPLSIWLHDQGVASRVPEYGRSLGLSIRWSLGLGGFGVVSWYGVVWGAVAAAFALAASDRRRLTALVVGLVAIPALLTVTTLDGTRVFATASWAAALLVIEAVAGRTSAAPRRVDRIVLGALVGAALVVPAYQTTLSVGGTRLAWYQLVEAAYHRL